MKRSNRRWVLVLAVIALGAGVLLPMLREPARPPEDAVAETPWLSRITQETRSTRPSLMLVVYDARRRDDFSFGRFGNRRGDTPFLDSFRRSAAYFENAVSPGCWTVPVHASIFTGLGVCELGVDYYNGGAYTLPDRFLSLAQILGRAGYQTVAYADHPFFYNRFAPSLSLARGFEQVNIINDFTRYASYTNVGRPLGETALEERLGTPVTELTAGELREEVERFNDGERPQRPDLEADVDDERGLALAKLQDLFGKSPYFERRYGEEFRKHVFVGRTRPFFLFVNLHMCTIAAPDPGLYSRWLLKTLMLNASRKRSRLRAFGKGAVDEYLVASLRELAAGGDAGALERYLKHVFDNRFYDCTFRALWEFLEGNGLTDNLVTVVTSDHGLSFGENGESWYAHGGARPYEYITRVPLVIRFADGSAATKHHGQHPQAVSLTDVFPTLVDLGLGENVFPRPEPARAASLLDRLEKRRFERVLVTECAVRPDSYRLHPGTMGYAKAIYDGDQKLIVLPDLYAVPAGSPGKAIWPFNARLGASERPGLAIPTRTGSMVQLFDLSADPLETVDLAAQRPHVVERLTRMLPRSSWQCIPSGTAAPGPDRDQEAQETLRALGYVEGG